MKPTAEIAVMGGSGLYSMEMLSNAKTVSVSTPYGKVNEILIGVISGRRVAFLPRHGRSHSVPPHMVNYRANIWALKKMGVRRVMATTSCGSMNPKIRPGDMAVFGQFIDFTKGRPSTFHDGGKHGVVHVDMTEPYCPELSGMLFDSAKRAGVRVHRGTIYACTEGPRFETPAEIRALRGLGADLVGMTNVPECVLAREAEMCYAALGIVTNFAAGISKEKLTYDEVVSIVREKTGAVQGIFEDVIARLPEERKCPCGRALEGAGAHSPV
ncbi:MAG: S-methyl-5'-thioadenosine phosphorylase [Candidatus Hadarchaeales archaeon]